MMGILTPLVLALAVVGGPWTTDTKKDEFTDAVTTKATARGKSGDLFLVVSCDKDGLDLAIGSEKIRFGGERLAGGVKAVPVDFRVDDRPAKSLRLMSQSYLAFFLGGHEADKNGVIADLRTARSKILVRAQSADGLFITDEISAAGSTKAIGVVEATCRS